MKTLCLSLLVVGGVSLISSAYAVASTASAPKPVAHATSQCAPMGSLLDYYDRIPAKHFAGMGSTNRRSLLKRKGAIVDYKRQFIEIPGPAKGAGDIQKLQISLFPNGNEPWVAVSRIVRAQVRVPGTLNFYYGYNDAGGLREAASTIFPYKLKKRAGGAFENAYLPRKGLTIQIGAAGSQSTGPKYTYISDPGVEGNFFVRTG